MKQFLKQVAATVVGILLTMGLMFFFLIFSLISTIISASDGAVDVKDNSVLVLNLDGTITEQSSDNVLSIITQGEMSSLGLNDILAAIDKAKTNDDIKGIYIKCGMLSTDYATLQEIRHHLTDFKKSNKWIIAYGDSYMQGTYYLASIADKVYMNPLGSLDWHGVGAQTEYYKDVLAKLGVKYTVVKVGTYKSYTETYTEDHMSDANREQITQYITGIWDNVLNDVSASRHVDKATLNTYADGIMQFDDANETVKKHLVDQLLYADQVKAEVKKRLGIDDDDDVNQIGISSMKSVKGKGKYSNDGDEIAVYYCSGSITKSASTSYLNGDSEGIVSDKVCPDLEKLMKDDDVKAVVIRINSGGGDAYASEQIWHYISQLKTKKPVVISMGGAAASGGYYMACNASWIVAEPTTLTGSIGIFGLLPDMSGLLTEKLGVHFDEAKTNTNSTFSPVALARPLNESEMDYLQNYINRGYALFRQRVADGRKMKVDDVEKVAQGRVWLGQDALKLHLVDQLGTLDDAIAKAAALSKTTEYHTKDYPGPQDFMTQLMGNLNDTGALDAQLRHTLGVMYEPFLMVRTLNDQSPIQARIPYILKIK